MKKVKEKILYKAKWLALKEIIYKGKCNEDLVWESIERNNTSKTVVIIAKLIPSNRYLFIKQYRPAVDKYVIGFPAGLVEDNNLEKEALRELQEETGYVGKIKSISPTLYSNAALLTDTVRVVEVEVDENIKENINPEQKLEAEEEIEVLLVEKNNIRNFLLNEEKKGIAIGVGPWYTFCENIRD
ncbi:NUDIX domain-containing protein [Clostridium sp. DJ247]|uniref:NUDIX domain-containing protein n=1 Tax=Clostridium sp. DJ247 TaxID=2726188 RepID=UPI00162A6675|nr:NUDIX hydrolase [Clostridium sp. DJ247]MBC2580777.1 NUDIX hydrolase [Clostridium sp. DJ247]